MPDSAARGACKHYLPIFTITTELFILRRCPQRDMMQSVHAAHERIRTAMAAKSLFAAFAR